MPTKARSRDKPRRECVLAFRADSPCATGSIVRHLLLQLPTDARIKWAGMADRGERFEFLIEHEDFQRVAEGGVAPIVMIMGDEYDYTVVWPWDDDKNGPRDGSGRL